MNKNLILTGIIAVVVIIFIVGVFGRPSSSPSAPRQENISAGPAGAPAAGAPAAAPTFFDTTAGLTLTDYGGKKIALADFKGKPLVVNAWASWCPFCRQELPDFATVQKELGDKVVFIAVDRGESLAVAKQYSDARGVTNSIVFLLDPGDSFYQAIGGFSMPETVFVDKNGNIVDHKRGPMDVNEIRQRTEKILVSPALGSDAQTQTSSASAPPNKTSQRENVVTYSETGFSPSILRVKAGTIVVFKNGESEAMWVASNPHPIHTDYSGFDAKRGYANGESYSFTFAKPGTWKYHNHLNPGEGGTIVVE